jgi:flavin reductase (DIM6/NTAB) family NADH-FMN oxidoreductase RutF
MLIDFMRGLTYSVNLIVTSDEDGNPHGATISSLISLNVNPQKEELLLVLKKNSHTITVLRKSPLFTISLLNRNQSEVAKYFSMSREILNSREHLIPSRFQEKIVHFAINPSAELVCEFTKEYIQDESVIVIANVLQTKINDLSKVLTYSQRTYN